MAESTKKLELEELTIKPKTNPPKEFIESENPENQIISIEKQKRLKKIKVG